MKNRCAAHDLELSTLRRALDRLSDSLKEALLDAGIDDLDGPDEPAAPLPPVPPDALVAALRPAVDDVLYRVAEAINRVPDVRSAGWCEKPVADLLAELLGAAVETGFRLRIEAAEAEGGYPRPQGEWARKYRQMLATDGHWPPPGE